MSPLFQDDPDAGDQFTWPADVSEAGRWKVYARWVVHATLVPTDQAVYTIHHAGGTTQVTKDQTVDADRWVYLGAYDLDPAEDHKVVLTNAGGTGGTWSAVADAVRFVRTQDARRVAADAVKLVPNPDDGILYVHANHLGSPQKLTDGDGSIVWAAAYTPFGLEHTITGAADTSLRFPGQYFDAETGLHQNWHRDYDPTTGRYIQSDPIGLEGGINTYAYVGANPILLSDPKGLSAALCVLNPRMAICRGGEMGRGGGGFGGGSGPKAKDILTAIGALIGICIRDQPNISGNANLVPANLSEECRKEWDFAIRECSKMLSNPDLSASRHRRGGYMTIGECARGLVSEDCGGNPIN